MLAPSGLKSVTIGAWGATNDIARQFKGFLDGAVVFDKVIDLNAVQLLYGSGGAVPTTVAPTTTVTTTTTTTTLTAGKVFVNYSID